MYLDNLKPYILFLRPANCVGTFVLVVLSTWLAVDHEFPIVSALLGAIGVALAAGAGSVINDIFDVQADTCNEPQRMLPSGAITKEAALKYYLGLVGVSLALLGLVNVWALLVGIGETLLLFLYSWKLREINGLLSNVVIALSLGSMLAFGAFITEHFVPQILLLFGFGVSVGLAREILGDATDVEGDARQGKLRTLPITLGVSRSLTIAILVLFNTATFSATPFVTTTFFDPPIRGFGPLLLYILSVSVVMEHLMKKELREAQTTLKGLLFVYPAIVVLATVL